MELRKKIIKLAASVMAVSMAVTGAVCAVPNAAETANAATARQVEALNRGLVAVKVSGGVYLSWRLLGTESYDTSFNVYRDGEYVASVADSTNYLDASGSTSSSYTVRTVVDGSESTESDAVTPLSNSYMDVPIQKPADTTLDGSTVTYSANDASIADLDGDGEYEIILKWNPSNAKDNSQSGYTSNVYIDAYELDGTLLWRIDLGKNIRAGAHYTQFIAYDLNGDGKAEVGMKTADGTVAGDGTVIGDSTADYRNSNGYVLSGPEYYTLFEGSTGKIITTIDYIPQRGTVSSWGDSYGNRVDRFLAGVGYLNGQSPYLIIARGYYTRTVIVAYRYKSGALARQWTFDTNSSTNKGQGYDGQGNHSLSIADVDSDGKDEIIYGSLVVDNDGSALNCTGLGHGDALHVGDFDPTISGLEIFQVHEEHPNDAGTQMRSAATGSQIWGIEADSDIGRGVVANMSEKHPYYIAWSSQGMYDKDGNAIDYSGGTGNITPNFAIWWDGDLYRELLDSNKINKWSDSSNGLKRIQTFSDVTAVNGTKGNPSLQADMFGDWKEEVMYPLSDSSALRIFISTSVTSDKLYTWMHDTQYRCAVAWQNVGYNQPPHPSFYVGPDMATPTQPSVYTVGSYTENAAPVSTPVPTEEPTAAPVYADIAEGVYYIKNVNSGLYLDVANGGSSNGTNIQQYAYNGSTAQQFKVVSAGDGYYQILTGCSDYAQAVDVEAKGTADGTNILTWTAGTGANQQFKFIEESDGSYGILTRITGLESALDVYNMSLSSGANVCQWSYWSGAGQRWYLEPVTAATEEPTETPTETPTEEPTEEPTETPTEEPAETGTDVSWSMGSSSFSGLGKISSSTTVDGLTLLATSAKTMKVSTSGALTLNGESYSTYLALGGSGNTSYRAMKFDVTGPCTINVVAKSSGSSERTLVVSDGSSTLGTISAPSSLTEGSFSYTGGSGSIYIYSKNSGINVYNVSVAY